MRDASKAFDRVNFWLLFDKLFIRSVPLFIVRILAVWYTHQVQLGPRYEGQLNPMAEPIPHEVRPLVRTHVYHPYHAADRQAETDS